MDLNRVIICGRLSQDTKMFTGSNGQPIARNFCATSRRGAGNQKVTEFIPLVAFGKIATEVFAKYCVVGKEVLIEGHLTYLSQLKLGDDGKALLDANGDKIYTVYSNIVVEYISLGRSPERTAIVNQGDGLTDQDLAMLSEPDETSEDKIIL